MLSQQLIIWLRPRPKDGVGRGNVDQNARGNVQAYKIFYASGGSKRYEYPSKDTK